MQKPKPKKIANNSFGNFVIIPKDVLLLIFSQLSFIEKIQLKTVSKKIKEIIESAPIAYGELLLPCLRLNKMIESWPVEYSQPIANVLNPLILEIEKDPSKKMLMTSSLFKNLTSAIVKALNQIEVVQTLMNWSSSCRMYKNKIQKKDNLIFNVYNCSEQHRRKKI